MSAREDVRELRNLRISMARVAQAAGVSLELVGLPDDPSYTDLHNAATVRDRGWNALAGLICETVEFARKDRSDLQRQIGRFA